MLSCDKYTLTLFYYNIKVKIIGVRFELNDPSITAIASF